MEGHDKGKEEGRKKTTKGMRKGRKREDENLKDEEKEKRERGNNTMIFFLKSMHLLTITKLASQRATIPTQDSGLRNLLEINTKHK